MYTKNDMPGHMYTEELELNGADNTTLKQNMEEKIISKRKLKLGKQL